MLKDYFEKNHDRLIDILRMSEYTNTSKSLLSFYEKSKSIDLSISALNSKSNIYPLVILLRCQIEHFIVATYIWIQFRITEKDDSAEIYYREYFIQEILKRLNYSKSNKIPLSSKYSELFQQVLDFLTDKKILKQKDLEVVYTKANQFDIKKISKFLDENLPLEYDNFIKPERIKSFLEYYNYFSSFVHGGPSADILMSEENNSILINESSHFTNISSSIVSFQRFYILYFISMYNKEIEEEFKIEMSKITSV